MDRTLPFELIRLVLALFIAIWLMLRYRTAAQMIPAAARRYAPPPPRQTAGPLLSTGHSSDLPALAKTAYQAIAARITAENHPKAGIILIGTGQFEAFAAHRPDNVPVYPLPQGRPHPAALKQELASVATPHALLYVIYGSDAREADPDHVIERWLDVYAFKTSDEMVLNVRLAIYHVGFKTPTVAVSRDAKFAGLDGETITLVEHTHWPATARPGSVIHVGLVWACDQTPARRYEVFLQLLDSAGNVIAWRDSEPEGGWRPVTEWKPLIWVVDRTGLLLPPDVSPGLYSLWLGLRDAANPDAQLPVGGSGGLELGQITITAR